MRSLLKAGSIICYWTDITNVPSISAFNWLWIDIGRRDGQLGEERFSEGTASSWNPCITALKWVWGVGRKVPQPSCSKRPGNEARPSHFYAKWVTGCDYQQRCLLEMSLLCGMLELLAWLIMNYFNCKSNARCGAWHWNFCSNPTVRKSQQSSTVHCHLEPDSGR